MPCGFYRMILTFCFCLRVIHCDSRDSTTNILSNKKDSHYDVMEDIDFSAWCGRVENEMQTFNSRIDSLETDNLLLKRKLFESEQKFKTVDEELDIVKEQLKNYKREQTLVQTETHRFEKIKYTTDGEGFTMPTAITKDFRGGTSKELQKRIMPPLDGRVATVSASTTTAFYALMTLHNEQLGIHQPIVFQNVITNDGNGYDKNTGVFKAAVAGTYSFTTTIMSHWSQAISVELIKEGHNVGSIYCGNTATYAVGSQSVIINMAVGDDFWVRVADNSHNTGYNKIYGGGFSSISGFLINALEN